MSARPLNERQRAVLAAVRRREVIHLAGDLGSSYYWRRPGQRSELVTSTAKQLIARGLIEIRQDIVLGLPPTIQEMACVEAQLSDA